MFEGFELAMIATGAAVIRVRHGGSGPPLLSCQGNKGNMGTPLVVAIGCRLINTGSSHTAVAARGRYRGR